jgi:hypothetical protein
MLRAATTALTGSLAVALALSLVGVHAADSSPAIQVGLLASIAVTACLIWRSRGSGAEPL